MCQNVGLLILYWGYIWIALVLAKFTFQQSLQTVLQHKLNSLFADSYKLVPYRDLTVR